MQDIVNLLHEVGMLAHTPRSGFAFLGSGQQSVAEHSYRMAMIGFVLAGIYQGTIDRHKLVTMCLLHDLPEARTGDLNYVNKKYVKADEAKAVEDIRKGSSFGPEIADCILEFQEGKTVEAQLAHDADQLELLLVLKRLHETGNSHAMDWFDKACQRLATPEAKKLAESIRITRSDAWWMGDRNDPHWIDGGKKKRN